MYSVPALPTPGVLADPSAFLTSPEGEAWIGTLADNFPHTRHWRERSDCWSLKSLNALAARIIDAVMRGTMSKRLWRLNTHQRNSAKLGITRSHRNCAVFLKPRASVKTVMPWM